MPSSSHPSLNFRLELCRPEDAAFLRDLNQQAYEAVVTAQFGDWDVERQRVLFDAKWRTQTFMLLWVDDQRVGCVSKAWSTQGLTLLELLLLPSHQNQGIGGQVVRELQREASAANSPLFLQVLHLNRARALYQRLGFRVIETTDTHYRMRWDAGG